MQNAQSSRSGRIAGNDDGGQFVPSCAAWLAMDAKRVAQPMHPIASSKPIFNTQQSIASAQ
jgi:hypothetical protein